MPAPKTSARQVQRQQDRCANLKEATALDAGVKTRGIANPGRSSVTAAGIDFDATVVLAHLATEIDSAQERTR
jgi:hypothetical protein